MIIKALEYSKHDSSVDSRFIAEVRLYNIKKIHYQSSEERDKLIYSMYSGVYAPFELAYDKMTEHTRENKAGHCMLIQIIEPKTETPVIILENCAVFIENDQGQTVDTLHVVNAEELKV